MLQNVHSRADPKISTDHESPRLPPSPVARFPWSTLMELLAVVGCLALSITIGVVTIPPTPRTDFNWWQTSVIYHIYPLSFQDSDGNGVGDIKGITSRLNYVKSLGVGAIWLGPVYRSAMVDFGYDVTNHTDIDPIFGDMFDMQELIDAAHNRDIKVIIDFIPNHTSDRHPWFESSRLRSDEHKDFYIWHDGLEGTNGSRIPPNNWMSAFGGSAWTWDEKRQQFYFHQFASQQPDLNFRNPRVAEHIDKVLEFWLVRGVDGFRVDAVDFLFEVEELHLNEPRPTSYCLYEESDSSRLLHIHTRHLPEVHTIITRWRSILEEHENRTGQHVFMITETFDNSSTLGVWRRMYESGSDMPFNFYLMEQAKPPCTGQHLRSVIEKVVTSLPDGKWLNWVIGSHDQKRVATKYGVEYTNIINALILLLPGTGITYQGEEIGMQDVVVSYEQTRDPIGQNAGPDAYVSESRDGSRSPMQWSPDSQAGFTTANTTWLPVHSNYTLDNVQVEEQSSESVLSQYKQLLSLRELPAFRWGAIDFSLSTDEMFSFVRHAFGKRYPRYLVALNVGRATSVENYVGMTAVDKIEIPTIAKLVLVARRNGGVEDTSFEGRNSVGSDLILNMSRVMIVPGEGFIAEFYSTSF